MRMQPSTISRMVVACALLVVLLPRPTIGQRRVDRPTQSGTAADSAYQAILIDYLRANFDDIHDVSMRFHHHDHTIGGLVVFSTVWENGMLDTISVAQNDTGNDDLPAALIEKFRTWRIEGLDGPFETNLPLNIRLVGSEHPAFPETAIVTGTVKDEFGQSVHGAVVEFVAASVGQPTVPPARTNRDGVFVRTLIPVGEWKIICRHPDFGTALIEGVELEAGKHHRERIVLKVSTSRTVSPVT